MKTNFEAFFPDVDVVKILKISLYNNLCNSVLNKESDNVIPKLKEQQWTREYRKSIGDSRE